MKLYIPVLLAVVVLQVSGYPYHQAFEPREEAQCVGNGGMLRREFVLACISTA